jgi:hypothetical protein
MVKRLVTGVLVHHIRSARFPVEKKVLRHVVSFLLNSPVVYAEAMRVMLHANCAKTSPKSGRLL